MGARARAKGEQRQAPAARPPDSDGASAASKLAYFALATLVALLPLVFDPRLGGLFRLPKLLLAEILGLASLTALAAGGRLGLAALIRAEAARAALPLVVVAAALAPFAAHADQVGPALLSAVVAVGCLIGWSAGFAAERLRSALRWGLPAAGASGLLGLAQALDWFQPFGVASAGVTGAERLAVIGLAGNPGDLGAALVLPGLVAQAELARRRSPLALFAAVGCLAGVVATQTLTALAALVVGSLFVWSTAAPARRRIQVAATAFGVVIVATLLVAPARQRAAEKWGELRSGDWNATLTGRLDGWRPALEIFRQHPWTGSGLGTFRAEFADAKAELLARGVEFFRRQHHPVFANAHSEPLEVAAELGLFGLAALGWGLWRLLRWLRRLRRRAPELAPAEAGLARGGAVAFLLLAAFGFPFRVAIVAYPGLVFFAWVFALTPAASARAQARSGAARWWSAAAAVALAAATLLRYGAARELLEAQRLLRSVELRTNQMIVAGRVDPRLVGAHLSALEDAARRDPTDVAIRLARGNQYLLLGSLPAAIDAYREAQRLERRPETHLNLGQALARSGCDAEAETEWAWAVRLDPTLRRQLPSGWRQWNLEGRLFATGSECGLESWSAVCGGSDAGCTEVDRSP